MPVAVSQPEAGLRAADEGVVAVVAEAVVAGVGAAGQRIGIGAA